MRDATARERPILFSGPMVQAILAGRKTQTRRVVRWAPVEHGVNLSSSSLSTAPAWTGQPEGPWALFSRDGSGCWNERARAHCPFGLPGDRLWVKETWSYVANEALDGTKRRSQVFYEGTSTLSEWIEHEGPSTFPGGGRPTKKRSPIHMPRWASRLTLEIDGGAFVQGRHTSGPGFRKDAEKMSEAAARGWRVLRLLPEWLSGKQSARTASWIRRALQGGERP